MELFTKQQKELCLTYYQECKSKDIDPTANEAARQRALLLAKENKALEKLFGDKLDGGHVEAYRIGKEYKEELAADKKKAEEEANTAEQRRIDEQAAELEKSLSKLYGRDKRIFFYQQSEAKVDEELKEANSAYWSIFRAADSQIKMGQQSESSWGTLGGIAAGVTGSTTVGAAVAFDTMNKNAGVGQHNAAVKQAVFDQITPVVENAQRNISTLEKKKKSIQNQMEKIKFVLTEDHPLEFLMDGLTISTPEIAFTRGNTMLIQAGITATKDFTIAGSEAAVIDGSFLAEVYEGKQKIGEAYLNLPLGGAKETVNLMGHCLTGKPGVKYTVLILPLSLWLIEKHKVSSMISDLKQLIPSYAKKYSWAAISQHEITWQQRVEERRLEAEKKAEAQRKAEEEERLAKEARKKKNKKIAMIAAPIAVVLMIALVLISTFMKAQQEEAARLEAYNSAVALTEAGEYSQAVAAFAALGNYKDSAEQINSIKYIQATKLMDTGSYEEAIAIFTELGDYQDSIELISGAKRNIELEEKYTEALMLLADMDFEAARTAFAELGDYKDAKTYLDGFAIRLTSWTYDDDERGEYQYNNLGDVIRSGSWTYEYSPDKRTVTRRSGDTRITEQYNEQGLLVEALESNRMYTNVTSNFSYQYNSDGTVATRTEKRTEGNMYGTPVGYDSIITYEYDGDGRVSKEVETKTSFANARAGNGPSNITVREYHYDINGQMLSRTDSVTGYNSVTGEAKTSQHEYQYTSGWVYAPDAEK